MRMASADRSLKRRFTACLAILVGCALPSDGRAEWTRIPLLPQVNYIQGMAAGADYLYASMADSSWNRMGLFRTPLESPGTWEFLGLSGYSLRSLVVAGDGDSHILVPGSTSTATIFGSTDGGQTWEQKTGGIPQGDGRVAVALAWNGVFPGRVYASVVRGDPSGFWIYSSTDFGLNWTEWTDGGDGAVAAFRYFAVPQDGGLVAYSLMATGFFQFCRYKTTNGGAEWSRILPYYWSPFIDLEVSTDRRDLFASTEGSLLYWRDDSPDVTGAILPPLGHCGVIGAETPIWAPDVLFVAGADAETRLAAAATQDPYTEWSVIDDGLLPDGMDPCEAYDPFTGARMFLFEAAARAPYLFLSAPGGHLWTREMSDVVDVSEPSGAAVGGLEILPPRPNPASGGVVFRTPAVQGQPITVEVVDVSGRLIRRWTTTPAASDGSFTWDGRGVDGRSVPPGAYYLKVESSMGVATTAFSILR